MRNDLARKHLDRRLIELRSKGDFVRPARGWLRAIREAVGMTTAQFAARLGVSQPRIITLERAEQRGAITLDTLSRAAQALDCTLVYALVPNSTLDTMVRERAREVASEKVQSIDHSMQLENQGISSEALIAERERIADELLRGNLHRLWDNP